MEEAAGVKYDSRGYVKPGCPTVITYADDFVALCHSREQAETVQAQLGAWLKDRGLSLTGEKTRIGRIDDGFNFLSFTIRRYHVHNGTKVLTKPSHDALKKIRRRNAAELRALRGASPLEVINTMNPIIRGQANYFRPGHPRRPTRPWTTTYGSTSTRGPAAGTPKRTDSGSRPATSARSTRPGATSGSTATEKPAPTSTTTPGRRSSGTSRSSAGTHLTTLPWPDTGPTGDVSANLHNWPRPGNTPCVTSTDNARCAGNRCCSPTAYPTPSTSGKPGSRPPERR